MIRKFTDFGIMVLWGVAITVLVLICAFLSGCATIRNCEIRMKPGAYIGEALLDDCTIFRDDGATATMKHVVIRWSGKKDGSAIKAGDPSPEEILRWISELKRLGIAK